MTAHAPPTSAALFAPVATLLSPNGTDDKAQILAALAAFPTVTVNNGSTTKVYPVGVLKLATGTFKLGVSGDLGNIGPFARIEGAGREQTTIAYYGSGDCIRAYNEVHPTDNTFDSMFGQQAYGLGGRFTGLTIDGANSSAGAIGLHVGDYEGGAFDDLHVQHFNKSGSLGIYLHSIVSWTENWQGDASTWDCTTHVKISAASGAYSDYRFKIYALPNQDGVVITGATSLYNGSLAIRGNFGNDPTSNTGAVLRLSGGSTIYSQTLDIKVEGNSIATPGTVGHQTINFGDVTADSISNCSGSLHFGGGHFQNSNWTDAINHYLGFDGYIYGDGVLNTNRPQGGQTVRGPIATMARTLKKGVYDSATTSIDLMSGDFFDLGLVSSDITLAFANRYTGPRKIFILAQQSGGIRAITWTPGNGQSVQWEGGAPPLLTRISNAYDLFELRTLDGALWFGKQHPGYATATVPTYVGGSGGALSASTSSQALSVGTAMAIGSTCVVAIANLAPGSGATPTVTDTKSNTWTVDKSVGSTGAVVWLVRSVLANALTTSDTVTVAWSGTTAAFSRLMNFSGLGSSAVLDQYGSTDNATTSAASIRVASPANTTTNDMAIAFAACGNSDSGNPTGWAITNAPAPSGSWTAIDAGSGRPVGLWIVPVPNSRAISATVTPSGGSQPMTGLIATYS